MQFGWLSSSYGSSCVSILGPKLYILYIINICNISNLEKFILFADDTNIILANNNMSRQNETICSVLGNIVHMASSK